MFFHRRTCTTGVCGAQSKAPDLCLRNEAERSGLAAPSALRPGQTRTNNASSLIFCSTPWENDFTPKTRRIYPKHPTISWWLPLADSPAVLTLNSSLLVFFFLLSVSILSSSTLDSQISGFVSVFLSAVVPSSLLKRGDRCENVVRLESL